MSENKKLSTTILTLLVIGVAVCLPLIFTKKYYTNLMNQVLINIVVVVGLNFITGLTGQMNLGTAGIFSLGAYVSTLVVMKLGMSTWVGLLASIVSGLIVGLCLGYPSLRLKGVYLSLTTIGFSEAVRIIINNLDELTGGAQGISRIPGFSLFGFEFNNNVRIYYLYLTITLILVFIASRIVNSKWGRAFKAIKDNPEAVETLGIDIAKLKILAFTLATIYGSIGGSMYAHFIRYINPATYNVEFSINYVIMLVIGGVSSVPGSVMGAILVTLTPELLRFLESYYWLVFSVITLVFVIFLPNGIISIFDGRALPRFRKGGEGGVKGVSCVKN